ncbi:MAG TPA: hypothetical protein VF913_06125 [Xanthobacteraceae bacterium]
MASSIASLLIPAALFLGGPAAPHATYEQGLFCDSVEFVASIVQIADRGGDPYKAVSDLNRTLDRKACFYTNNVDVLMAVGRFQRAIAANSTTYGIYEVYISAVGHQTTEIGSLAWKFSRPMVMYTLREAPARDSAEIGKPSH